MVTRGQIDESSARGEYRALASSIVLKAAGCEHDDRIGGFGAKTLTIRFERQSRFGRMIPDGTWSWSESPHAVRLAIATQCAFADGRANDVERNAVALIEELTATPIAESRLTWLNDARRLLEEHFDETIDFASLARDLGLHPVYASRAFKRHVGLSMTDYVRALRVREARRELATTRRSIASIAATAGFADSGHLCRTFVSLIGVTPRAYRRIVTR